jgi:HSP20 family protein
VAPRDVDRLHDEIEELFSELWRVPRFVGQRRGFRPAVDSYHTDDPHVLTILVELAGVEPGSVAVVVADRLLVVSGDRTRPHVEGRVFQQMEIEYGPFQRQVRLPEDVDPARADAEYDRGLLRITLPVAEAPPLRGRVSIPVGRSSRRSEEEPPK